MQSPKCAVAGFGTRWAAYVIDCLITGFLSCFVTIPAAVEGLFTASGVWNRQILFHLSAAAIAAYCIRAVYFVVFTYAFGKTPGKMLLRIQVESLDGEKLTFLNVLFRETVGRFLSGILYIGYLVALAGKDHFALHDMLCDTRVCYTDLAEVVRVRPVIIGSGPMPQMYAEQNDPQENGSQGNGSGPMPQMYAGQDAPQENGSQGNGSGPVPGMYAEHDIPRESRGENDREENGETTDEGKGL